MTEFKKGQEWNKPLTEDMKDFEAETGKNAVFKGAITGSFEYWLYMKEQRKLGNVRKRRTKSELKKVEQRKKVKVEVTKIEFTPKQLLYLTKKHANKLVMENKSRVPYKQIIILLDKLKTTPNPDLKDVYKEHIIKIFDNYGVPYSKKYIKTVTELK